MHTKKIVCISLLIFSGLFIREVSGGGKGGVIIGDQCNVDSDCSLDIGNSKCDMSSNSCVCEDGFYQIDEQYCSQVLGDRNYGCNSDCECQMFVPNSICINRIVCACKPGYDMKNNNTCDPDAATSDALLNQCSCKNPGNMAATSLLHLVLVCVPVFLTLIIQFKIVY